MPIACIAAMAFAVSSCSDDNDEPNPNPGDETVTVNPTNVFPQGAPSQVGDYVITKNADGLVSKIVDGDEVTTFNYTPVSSRAAVTIPSDYDMTMNVQWGSDPDGVDFYIKLNNQGFIEYAYEVDQDPDHGDTAEEWWFKYNDDGQLIEMKRTEGDNEVTTITYNATGDITTVKVRDDEDGEKEIITILYTDANQSTSIVNKSGIMLYDAVYRIDMDEMAPAYYAGLLGKGTTNLPLSAKDVHTSSDYSSTTDYTFDWTLDNANMPIKLTRTEIDSYGHEDKRIINLKW